MAGVLEHISFARDWLERAENKLRAEEQVEGELFLSLAEAEIRKAWENSLFTRKNGAKRGNSYRKLSWGMVFMALGIIIIILFNSFNSNNSSPPQTNLKLTLPRIERRIENSWEHRLIDVNLTISDN